MSKYALLLLQGWYNCTIIYNEYMWQTQTDTNCFSYGMWYRGVTDLASSSSSLSSNLAHFVPLPLPCSSVSPSPSPSPPCPPPAAASINRRFSKFCFTYGSAAGLLNLACSTSNYHHLNPE